MINTKTLTCSNCHGGDFIRLDDNEFKCTHCGSITLVEDDVAQRLEQLLGKLQAPAPAAAVTAPSLPARTKAVLIWVPLIAVVIAMVVLQIVDVGDSRDAASQSPSPRADVDAGLLKIEDLHRAGEETVVGLVRNDSDRVVSSVSLGLHTFRGALRVDDVATSTRFRMLPGESQPIVFNFWKRQDGERFEIAQKEVRTDDDFNGRAQLRLTREQLIRKDEGSGSASYRFIGRLTNPETTTAKFVAVSVQLYDRAGKLIGTASGSPESMELAPGETTQFSLGLSIYSTADIGSMRYVIDSERVKAEDTP